MKKLLRTLIFFLLVTNISFATIKSEMKFIENKGQWDNSIKFTTQKAGLNSVITENGIYFDFYKKSELGINGNVIKMNLENSNNWKIVPKVLLNEKFNYFYSNKEENWVNNVRTYSSILIDDIYQGIDMKLYTEKNEIRYDFIVEPYANLDQISISYDGIDDISLEQNNVIMEVNNAIIENNNLYTYQIINNKKVEIESNFKIDNNRIKFNIGNYDRSKELIIDPVVFASYFGSPGDDIPGAVKSINDSTIVLVGSTNSPDFKTTVGAYDEEYGDRTDAFITKFRVENSEYIPEFTSFIGSLEFDHAVDVLQVDNYYLVAGITESADFPNVKALKKFHSGGTDIFITSFNLTGDTILQSTYYGGTNDDYIVEMAVDRNNYTYYVGYTNSSDIQTFGGPPKSNYKAKNDILLFSLNPARDSKNLSIYLGGQLDDIPYDMYFDKDVGNIYITGYTTSAQGSGDDFPTYPVKVGFRGGPYDGTYNGNKDGFGMMLSPNGNSIEISTYFGGDGDDIGKGIWSDQSGKMYVMGETYNNASANLFPVFNSSSTPNVNGNSDLFIMEFNKLKKNFGAFEQTLSYSALINTIGDEEMFDFKKHPIENKFSFLISTNGIFEKVNANDVRAKKDIVYSEITPTSGTIINSDIYAGNEDDIPVNFDFDNYGNYIISGYTTSSDIETTSNSSQESYNLKKEIFLVKNSSGSLSLTNPTVSQSICVGNEILIQWKANDLDITKGYQIGYSLDGDRQTFTTIAKNITKTDYLWEVPAEFSENDSILIRVSYPSGVYAEPSKYYKLNERAKINLFEVTSSDTLCIGETINLVADITGVNSTFTWFRNNIEVAKTATNTLEIKDVELINSGNYIVSVKNDCPPESTSDPINIYVSPNTSVNEIESDITKLVGESLEIKVEAIGVELDYIWQKDGKDIPKQTGNNLNLSNLSEADAGKYRCFVVGKCGTDSTNIADVKIETTIFSVEDNYFDIKNIADINESNKNLYQIKLINKFGANISLYNNLGTELLNDNIDNYYEIDLSSYSNGVYWIVVEYKGIKYKSKLVRYN